MLTTFLAVSIAVLGIAAAQTFINAIAMVAFQPEEKEEEAGNEDRV